MLTAAALLTIAVLLLIAKYMPITSENLIEGMLARRESGADMKGGRVTAFWFENYCKKCFDEKSFGNNSPYGRCLAVIPARAKNTGAFEPASGDCVKIVARRNIFGRIVSYEIIKSDFFESYGPKLRAMHEEHYRTLGEALDKREALARGMTVGEYRAYKEDRQITFAMGELGMTREEVIAAGFDKASSVEVYLERMRRRLSRELGRDATREDVLGWERQKMAECTYPSPECLSEYEIRSYGETGSLPEDRLTHLEACMPCGAQANIMREDWTELHTPPGAECITEQERSAVQSAGMLPAERTAHLERCRRCRRTFDACKTAFLDRLAPIPDAPHPSIVFTLKAEDVKAHYARLSKYQ